MSAKGGGGSQPQMPDFTGLASQMASYDWMMAQYETAANRPNINTPTGSMTWTGPGYQPFPGGFGGTGGGGAGGGGTGGGTPPSPTYPFGGGSRPITPPPTPTYPFNGGGGLPPPSSTPFNGGSRGSVSPSGLAVQQQGQTAAAPTGTSGGGETFLGAAPPPRQNTQWDFPNGGPYVAHAANTDGVYVPGYGFFAPKIPDWLYWENGALHNKNATDPSRPWIPPPNWTGAGNYGFTPSQGGVVGGGGGGSGGVLPPPNNIPVPPGYTQPPSGGGGGGGGGTYPGGLNGGWTMNVTLSPAEQAALEAQQRIRAGRSGMAEELLGTASSALQEPMPELQAWGSSPGNVSALRQRAEDAIYQRISSRLDPMWDQRQEALDVRLRNQGLNPGTEAYDRAMQEFERSRTDAYQTAINESITGGGAESQLQFGQELAGSTYENQLRAQQRDEAIAKRVQALNEIAAAIGGGQIQMPQFPGFSPAQGGETPDLLGAAGQAYQGGMQQYSQAQQQQANFMQGLFSLAPLLGMAL